MIKTQRRETQKGGSRLQECCEKCSWCSQHAVPLPMLTLPVALSKKQTSAVLHMPSQCIIYEDFCAVMVIYMFGFAISCKHFFLLVRPDSGEDAARLP